MDYLELAKKQFFKLQEDVLDEDRHCLGAANDKEYTVDDNTFTLSVDGFWESSTHFYWKAIDSCGAVIESGFWD